MEKKIIKNSPEYFGEFFIITHSCYYVSMNTKTSLIALAVVCVAVIALFASGVLKLPNSSEIAPVASENKTSGEKTQTENIPMNINKTAMKIPTMEINPEKKYIAVLHTDLGDISIELKAKETPATANNFVYLARNTFYDNTIFHRVIKGFMIQGGDPLGNGTGGPGYKFTDEPFEGEYTRGTVAMANAGPNTNGSQFFIMHADVSLPKNYVIFGKVVSGLDVVDAIADAPVTQGAGGELSKPENPVVVKSVDIIEE